MQQPAYRMGPRVWEMLCKKSDTVFNTDLLNPPDHRGRIPGDTPPQVFIHEATCLRWRRGKGGGRVTNLSTYMVLKQLENTTNYL